MKVAIGQRIAEGPWGGGNNFVRALAERLKLKGHSVVFDLQPDADIALITDPRRRNPLVTFTPGNVLRHIARYPKVLVVHRINECDERKGTRTMNWRLRTANYAADATAFIASWLRDLRVWRGESEPAVILNGADTNVFCPLGNQPWDGAGPLRLVTHHWGGNRLKGFDVYQRLDAMLAEPPWRDRIAFTYVGNLPSGIEFRHVRHVEPLAGDALADELRRHHVYVTASINEPAGMHHIEGALCGLPLIYRRSGALPEYCDGYGEPFDGPEDFVTAVERMGQSYGRWCERLASYPHTAEAMSDGYIEFFESLVARRDEIVAQRRLWRDPVAGLATQLPM